MAQVRTRKRGRTWSYIFEAGQVNGKRKVVEKGGFATKDYAYTAGVAAYTDWQHGNVGVTSDNISFRDFMTNYMQTVVALNVRASTFNKYHEIASKLILPQLGDYRVKDITTAILDRFIRAHAKTGYSRNYLLQIRRLVNQTLSYAVFPAELISSNPTMYVKIPKSAPRKVIKRTVISFEQYKSFIEKYPLGQPAYMPVTLMYHTGMRIGEALGLSWNDVDFSKHTITITHQLIHVNNIGNLLSEVKTEYSQRVILIDNILIDKLKQWKTVQTQNELAQGSAYCIIDEQNNVLTNYSKAYVTPSTNRQNLVCTNSKGQNVSRSWVMTCLGREGINSHSFRHTHATVLVEDNAPLKGVARRLGHKNINVTDEVYTHGTAKMQKDVADIFAKRLQTK